MQATYAYYVSATFIPPSKPDVFFYFGVEPTAYLGLRVVGSKSESRRARGNNAMALGL